MSAWQKVSTLGLATILSLSFSGCSQEVAVTSSGGDSSAQYPPPIVIVDQEDAEVEVEVDGQPENLPE